MPCTSLLEEETPLLESAPSWLLAVSSCEGKEERRYTHDKLHTNNFTSISYTVETLQKGEYERRAFMLIKSNQISNMSMLAAD